MAATALAAFAQPARAQSAAPVPAADQPVTVLEDIIVTATRRSSPLQEIGIAVTALSDESLRQANIVTSNDLSNMTPGLSLVAGNANPFAGLTAIRGVAQNDFAGHLESSNTIYLDNVYRPSNGTAVQAMFDVERVEILKGPQGTLFGRNATGGLIHILTKEPTDEVEGYADVTFAEYNQISAQGAINLPLAENAAFRLAAYVNHNDGYIKNDIGPDQGADDSLSLRAKLRFEPNENLRIKLQGEWLHNGKNPAGGAYVTGGTPGADGLGTYREGGYIDTGYVDADGDPHTGSFNYAGFFYRDSYVGFADVSLDIGNATVTSITSYEDYHANYAEDVDLSPADLGIFRQKQSQTNFTQELRVNVDADKRRLTAGAYYLKIKGTYYQGFQLNYVGNYNQILAPINVLLFPVGANQYADYTLDTSSWSLFAQGEIDLGDRTTVTAGLRYTRDSKDYRYQNFCENLLTTPGCSTPDPTTLAGAGLVTDESSEGGVSARLQVDYRATPDWLLYASFNRGYKAFNYNAGFAGAAPVANVKFDGEKLNAFEVGSKLDFWSDRARFNISAFYYDYKDYQAFDQRGVSFVLSNTDATIYGMDAELTMRPGAGIDIMLGLSLLDTSVKDITIGGVDQNVEAPQAPGETFNFAISKDFLIGSGALRIGTNGRYVGHYYSQLNNAEVTKVGNFWNFDARISYAPDSGDWEVAGFVKNLFDKDQLLYSYDITFPGYGVVEQDYAKPRWFGAQFKVNF